MSGKLYEKVCTISCFLVLEKAKCMLNHSFALADTCRRRNGHDGMSQGCRAYALHLAIRCQMMMMDMKILTKMTSATTKYFFRYAHFLSFLGKRPHQVCVQVHDIDDIGPMSSISCSCTHQTVLCISSYSSYCIV